MSTNTWKRLGTIIRIRVGRGSKGGESGRAIHIASLNIRSGREGGFEAALRALKQGNIGIIVLQETNLTEGIHNYYSLGYKV